MSSRSTTDSQSDKNPLQALESSIFALEQKRMPPVHLWNPPYCGEIGLRIGADGAWSYLESPIGRKSLVKLFASVLRKYEDGRHYLVTPVEKIGIEVEDSPFLAVEMAVRGEGKRQSLVLRTNLDDVVTAGSEHPLRFVKDVQTGGLKPYVLVRGRLEARLTRALTYDLAELGRTETVDGDESFGVWSGGSFFAMASADELKF